MRTARKPSLMRFVSWWYRALRAALPIPIRGSFLPADLRLIVSKEADGYEVVLIKDGKALSETKYPAGSDFDLTDDLKSAGVSEANIGQAIRILRLPPEFFVSQTLVLPKMRPREMKEAIAWQLRRLSPFEAEDTIFAYEVVKADETSRTVFVVIGERKAAENLVLDALGKIPIGEFDLVTTESNEGTGKGLSLWPDKYRRRLRQIWMNSAAAAVAILMFSVANLHIYATRLSAEAELLQAAAEDRLARASLIQRDITHTNQRVKAAKWIGDQALGEDGLLYTLLELTQLTPDSSHLIELRYHRDEVRVMGFSAAASELAVLIESHPEFAEVRFNAPVVRQPQSGLDRFDISFAREADTAAKVAAEIDSGKGKHANQSD